MLAWRCVLSGCGCSEAVTSRQRRRGVLAWRCVLSGCGCGCCVGVVWCGVVYDGVGCSVRALEGLTHPPEGNRLLSQPHPTRLLRKRGHGMPILGVNKYKGLLVLMLVYKRKLRTVVYVSGNSGRKYKDRLYTNVNTKMSSYLRPERYRRRTADHFSCRHYSTQNFT